MCDRWLTSRADVRIVTVESCRYALAPVVRKIGNRTAASITAADVQRLVAWLSASGGKPTKAHPIGKPLGPRAVRLALIALAEAFDLADLPVNPVRHKSVRLPRQVERVGADLQHWRPAEVIHPGTIAALRALKVQQAKARLVAGIAWDDSGLVVVDELGQGPVKSLGVV